MVSVDANQNVGTSNHPVSWLHERTLALIYDELTRAHYPLPLDGNDIDRSEVRVRLTPDGEMSGNLLDGVESVHIPGEWDNVGGIVPDLILKDGVGNPVRIIEVVVTNPISNEKRRKLDSLEKRGVDCVEVVVKTERDLLNLCWVPSSIAFTRYDAREINVYHGRARSMNRADGKKYQGSFSPGRRASEKANLEVENLINSLLNCSPGHRRQFLEVCRALHSLDSLLPVHPLNPLKDVLDDGE